MSAALCPATITERRYPCLRPLGHPDRHAGSGWLWWHGNGEACPDDCMCRRADTEETA